MASAPLNVYACLPPTVRGQATPLKTDPKRNLLVYAVDRTVVLREITPSADRPLHCQLYTQHTLPVLAVAVSPSGAYVASGDAGGKVRVWACDHPDQPLKLETPVIGGKVLDIDWSPDSQRIVAVGEANGIYGKVFMWDSGNSLGEITAHAKRVNGVAYKPSRPFRIATGSDDTKVNFFEGPPFKYVDTPKQHERFVLVVKYAPDGERFLTASSDMSLCVFEGKEGKLLIGQKVHKGSIFGAAWSPDSKQIFTASGDKSVKVFDASTLSELKSVSLGSAVGDMQIGCVWGADSLLSYSLCGALTSLDPTTLAPTQTTFGHNRPIDKLVYDADAKRLYSASFAAVDETSATGLMRCWDLSSGLAHAFSTKECPGHASRIYSAAQLADKTLVTCAMDDALVFSSASPPAYLAKLSLGHSAKAMGAGAKVVAVVTNSKKLLLCSGESRTAEAEQALEVEPTCVDVSPNDDCIAVGAEDNTIRLLSGSDLRKPWTETFKLEKHTAPLSCVAFAPDSARLASGCVDKRMVLWDVVAGSPLVQLNGFHLARISCFAWSSGGVLASGGIDAAIFVWDLEGKKPKLSLRLTHASGGVNSLAFVDETTLASAGSDACIKTWKV